jgi:hypothetical protein
MSMKRTKQTYRGAKGRDSYNEAGGDSRGKGAGQDWGQQVQSQPDSAFLPYAQTGSFGKGAFILHPSMGKGIVLRVEKTRIEVLFQDGVKKLVHTAQDEQK